MKELIFFALAVALQTPDVGSSTEPLDLLIKGGTLIRLPEKNPRRAWDRLAFLASEYGLLDRGLAAIDMRLPDRLVLRPPKGALPAATAPGKST